ncbi:helix-turn-helix domain-containing protein, partial [uncultured Alistipes sp.]|uniref:helix-turn-helix domain-containing protein n=2 Tax=uncultured Alistipes sp. TaxID=538949 RepID=UPI0032206F49
VGCNIKCERTRSPKSGAGKFFRIYFFTIKRGKCQQRGESMAGKYKYLTFEDRQKIEAWHARGDRPLEIAARLGVHTATIYNELKRGYVGELDSRQREIYKAERAQATVQEHFKRRGRTAATAGKGG